jgi:predicted dehydrogenase
MMNVGIIGCGSIARVRHAPEYASNKDVTIRGFFDPVAERALEMTAQYGGKAYASYEEMLADEAVDAVSICTANRWHAPIALAALRAGKHVLCEKPMASSAAEAEEMIAAAKQAGRFLMIGHNQRLAGMHIKAKKILAGGELGRILHFSTTFSHRGPEAWSADKSNRTWFFSRKDASMGAMGDLGIHKADLIRWLIGDEITEVTALVTTLDKKTPEGERIEVDDHAVCILQSRTGIVGTLTASWTNYGEENNSTVLYCSEGVMKINGNPRYPLEITMKNGERIHYEMEGIQTNDSQTRSGIIDLFVESVVRNTPPEISGEEGLAALRIIAACMESSATGQKVRIK